MVQFVAKLDVCDGACHTSRGSYSVVVSNCDDVEACYDAHVEETDFGCGVRSPGPERFLVGIVYPCRMILEF